MRFLASFLLLVCSTVAGAELELQGTYERRTDVYSRRVLGDAVCFVVDERFAKKLPRPADDERRAWFCFSNTAHALKAFGLGSVRKGCGLRGPATIAISAYAVAKDEPEAVDKARLERVISRGVPKPIPCNE